MFHPVLPAVMGVSAIGEASPDLGNAFHDLAEALARGARSSFITPALLRTVGKEAADDLLVEECRQQLLDNIETFSRVHFSYSRANKIRFALHMRSREIGGLRAKIEVPGQAAVQAAREFVQINDRNSILDVIDRLDREAGSKATKLDGAARERIVVQRRDGAVL